MDIEMYETFTRVWNSFIQNSTMLGLEDRFLPLFEQISESYVPTKGPLIPYMKRKINWALQIRSRQRVRNYHRAAGYIDHLSALSAEQGNYGAAIVNRNTLSTLIARADLSDNEKRVLSAYCLNPSEPTMREVGDRLHITGERVRQISESIIKKLRKVNERGDRNAFNKRRYLRDIKASEGKYSSGHSRLSGGNTQSRNISWE